MLKVSFENTNYSYRTKIRSFAVALLKPTHAHVGFSSCTSQSLGSALDYRHLWSAKPTKPVRTFESLLDPFGRYAQQFLFAQPWDPVLLAFTVPQAQPQTCIKARKAFQTCESFQSYRLLLEYNFLSNAGEQRCHRCSILNAIYRAVGLS